MAEGPDLSGGLSYPGNCSYPPEIHSPWIYIPFIHICLRYYPLLCDDNESFMIGLHSTSGRL